MEGQSGRSQWIFWLLRSGAQCYQMPECYPPHQTCHRRFQRWVRDGTLECLVRTLAVAVASASPHEVTLVERTLRHQFVQQHPQRLIGDRAYDNDALDEQLAERGIELIAPHRHNRATATQDGRALRRYCRCWKIERLWAWLQNYRRIVARYERYAENYLGFVHLRLPADSGTSIFMRPLLVFAALPGMLYCRADDRTARYADTLRSLERFRATVPGTAHRRHPRRCVVRFFQRRAAVGHPSCLVAHLEQSDGVRSWWQIIAAALVLPLVMFGRGACDYVSDYLMNWVGLRVVMDVRARVFEHLQSLSLDFYTASRTGDLISRVTNDVHLIQRAITQVTQDLVKQPFTLVAVAAYLFYTDWKLTLGALVVFPICLVPILVYGRKIRKASQRAQELQASLLSVLHEALVGARVVKAFGAEQRETEDFRQFPARHSDNKCAWRVRRRSM